MVCPENTTGYADGEPATPVEWQPPSPTDNSGELQWTNASHNPNDIFYVGNTVVTYTAWDNSGNGAICSFTVTVIGNFLPF